MKISIEFKNLVPNSWHEITDEQPAMYDYIFDFETDEQYQFFCLHYLEFRLKDNMLFFDEGNIAKTPYGMQKRIVELKELLTNQYDKKAMQHERCLRMGIPCKHDIAELDKQAEAWVAEINELEELLK